jgi:outer membrane protein assembly factor BamB
MHNLKMAVLLFAAAGLRPLAADWPCYRGARLDGVSAEPIQTEWAAGKLAEIWRRPVGGGYAGISVAGGRVFTLEQRGRQEVLAAYDASTGKELWTNAWPGEFKSFLGGNGPRSTPSVDAGRVYVSGALGELRAVDAATGRLLWRRDLRAERGETVRWGNAWSPLAAGSVLYVQPNAKGASVAALDSATGKTLWQALEDEQAYTTPMLVELAGRKQLLVVTAGRAAGLDPSNGALLWSHPWKTGHGINVAQPLVVDGRQVLLSAGYGHGSMLLEVECGNPGCAARPLWENKNLKSKFNSPVFWQGHVYGLDEGILTCIDLATGARKWKGGRYGYGQLILASGHLVVSAEQGEVALVEAAPGRFREKARFRALDGKTWNMPALSGGVLYVRNEKEMAAFRIAP